MPDDEGLWHLTGHARKRVRQGHRPATRKPPIRYVGADRGHGPMTPRVLPLRARCRRCGTVNVLDPSALGVEVVGPSQISRGIYPPAP
jgi:hypothetical protein